MNYIEKFKEIRTESLRIPKNEFIKIGVIKNGN